MGVAYKLVLSNCGVAKRKSSERAGYGTYDLESMQGIVLVFFQLAG